MSGYTFSRLPNLKKVWLNFNTCINVNLEGETKIATLSRLIPVKCENNSDIPENCESLWPRMKKLEDDLRTANEKNEVIHAEKLQCENRVKQILHLQSLWEIRWDATFASKTGELYNELKKRKIEITEKDLMIKNLEKQIASLSNNRTVT